MPFDATILDDPDFKGLSPQAQRQFVEEELRDDPDFRGISPQAQQTVRDDLFKTLKPLPTFGQKAQTFGAIATQNIPSGALEVPGSIVTLPNMAMQGIEALPFQGFLPEGQIPLPGGVSIPTPSTLRDMFSQEVEDLEQLKEGTRQRFGEAIGLPDETIQQMIEESQLGPGMQTAAAITGELIGGLGVGGIIGGGKRLGRSLFSKPAEKATETVTTLSKRQPGDQIVKRNELAAPEIVPAPEGSFERTMEDMARANQLGIPEAPVDSPLYDIAATSKVFPDEPQVGKVSRATRLSGLDALSVIDRIPGLRGAGERLRSIKELWERRTSISFNEIDNQLTQIWGRRGGPKSVNPLRAQGMEKRYNITQEEVENLVNVLYSQGRVQPLNDKVDATASMLFELATKPRNQRAMELEIPIRKWNEATQEFDLVFRTSNNPFMPHIPVDPKTREKIDALFFRRAYLAARQKEPSLTPGVFARRVAGFTNERRDIRRFRGLEAERIFDAEAAGGGNAYKGLKEFGYETDPLRAIVHYMAAADRRIVQEESKDIFTAIRQAADASGDKQTSWFVNESINRMNGHNIELTDQMTTDLLGKLRSINTATLLQFATVANMNQLNLVANKFGIVNTLRSAVGLGPLKGVNPAHAKASGAIYNVIMQEFTNPSHKFGKWAMAQLYANGFTASERWMRSVAAHAGAASAQDVSEQLLKAYARNPGSSKVRNLGVQMKAHGIDPDTVIAQGGLSEDDLLHAAQRFANESVGRHDVTAVPLGLATDNKYWKTVLQFKQFAFANLAEMQRQVRNQPTIAKKIAKISGLLGGGQLTGEVTRDLQHMLTSFEAPTLENRTPKVLKKQFGDQIGRLVDNQLAGLASVYSVVMMAWLVGEKAIQSELLGPTISGAVDLVYKTVDPIVREGDVRKGVQQAGKELSRRVPIAGPRIRDFLREESTPGLRSFQLPSATRLPTLPGLGN